MKLGEASPGDIDLVKHFPTAQVRILWCDDFWDGPVQGIAEVEGERVLFDVVDPNVIVVREEHRRFWLVSLNPQQLAEEERWHELFCECVGTHFDLTGRKQSVASPEKHAQFYDAYAQRESPDYSQNELLGWFEL